MIYNQKCPILFVLSNGAIPLPVSTALAGMEESFLSDSCQYKYFEVRTWLL